MKCLVTGSCGFIGSHLCEMLIDAGHEVIGVDDLSNGSIENTDSIRSNPSFHLKLTNSNMLALKTIGPVDWVFHLAAKADIVPSIENPLVYHDTNVNGTLTVLEYARSAKVKKFVYAASSSCYGIPSKYPTCENEPCRPQYPYALTKWMGEQYVLHWSKLYKVPAVSLRLFNVYGPRHRTSGAYGAVFGVFLSQLANNKPLTIVGDGDQSRDFTYVKDVCRAFILAAEGGHGVYNVGSDGHYPVNQLACLLGAKEWAHLPKRPGEPDITFADITKIYRELNWYPKTSFEEGVAIMKDLIPKYKSAPLWTPEKIQVATKTWFEALT